MSILSLEPSPPPAAFIAALTSDIGRALARNLRARGWSVIGTYRDAAQLAELSTDDGVIPIRCDVAHDDEIGAVAEVLEQRTLGWDMFIGAVGRLAPIGPFFELDRAAWQNSAALNGLGQLALLHAIHPFRRARPVARVAFLVGGAINRSFPRYSAYSLGKLALVKFCELIHDECPDIHAVAVGTGWVATKIHHQTLAAAAAAGENLAHTEEFLARNELGTSMEDIMSCLDWCFGQDRDVTGGRNISIVHDPWRDGGAALVAALRRDVDKYKLRRHANS